MCPKLVACTPGHFCDNTTHTYIEIRERKYVKGSAWQGLGKGGVALA